ncbi:MAG TPA: hypothetical protein VHM28_04180 [Anaerolineales bacterium]|jgi:hypothetical protein|nr:hypothetical protein [Anaerolineales bacterium]
MAKAGKRYPLLIYTRMIDRWRPMIFLIGLALIALAWVPYSNPFTRLTESLRWMIPAAVGAGCILISLIMWIMRKSAYVQPFNDHLRLATPFLRLNISYRRIRRTTTASTAVLFPPKSLRGLRREIIGPLASLTAVIVEMNAMPMSMDALRFFLSPFFFKDKTPHLVLIVQNWMAFSTEIESMRVNATEPSRPLESGNQSILSRLPRK